MEDGDLGSGHGQRLLCLEFGSGGCDGGNGIGSVNGSFLFCFTDD